MTLVTVSFHQSGPCFDGMRSIDNPSREVLFEQIIFPLLHFNDSTNLLSAAASANAYLMSNRSFVNTVEHSYFSFRSQPHSPTDVTSKI